MRVTAAVHRLINDVKQYENATPPQAKSRFQRETLNCEPDNLSSTICITGTKYHGIYKTTGRETGGAAFNVAVSEDEHNCSVYAGNGAPGSKAC